MLFFTVYCFFVVGIQEINILYTFLLTGNLTINVPHVWYPQDKCILVLQVGSWDFQHFSYCWKAASVHCCFLDFLTLYLSLSGLQIVHSMCSMLRVTLSSPKAHLMAACSHWCGSLPNQAAAGEHMRTQADKTWLISICKAQTWTEGRLLINMLPLLFILLFIHTEPLWSHSTKCLCVVFRKDI